MININIVKNQICGNYGNVNFSIPYDEKTLKKLTDIQTKVSKETEMSKVKELLESFKKLLVTDTTSLVEDKCKGIKYNPATEKYYLEHNKKLSSIPIPQTLIDKIHLAIDKGLSPDPIVKFWIRLLRNPNIRNKHHAVEFTQQVCDYISQTFVSQPLYKEFIEQGMSEEKATECATVFQTPLTMEGLINAKKVVRPITDNYKYHYSLDDQGNTVKTLKDSYKDRQTIDSNTGEINIKPVEFSEDEVFEPWVMGTRGDDFYCGDTLGHKIIIGQETRLESWNQVNCNPHHSCVKGLKCGASL